MSGRLASGREAMGRMAEPDEIVDMVVAELIGGRGSSVAGLGGPPRGLLGRSRRRRPVGGLGHSWTQPAIGRTRSGASGCVVTAGGTREPIDPVRFLGNRSSGKMGNALAAACLEAGAEVELITAAPPPPAAPGTLHQRGRDGRGDAARGLDRRSIAPTSC